MFKYFKMARVVFQRFLDRNDFGMDVGATDISVPALKWDEIASYQVGAKQEIAYGVGATSDNGVDSRRTATIKIYETGAELTAGKLRLAYSDANGVTVQPIQEDLLANWSSGVALGEVTGLRVGEDSFLKILINLPVAKTIDMSETGIQCDVPVTVRML